MNDFIPYFDYWVAVLGGLAVIICMYVIWILLRDPDGDLGEHLKEDEHAMLHRMLDKGE